MSFLRVDFYFFLENLRIAKESSSDGVRGGYSNIFIDRCSKIFNDIYKYVYEKPRNNLDVYSFLIWNYLFLQMLSLTLLPPMPCRCGDRERERKRERERERQREREERDREREQERERDCRTVDKNLFCSKS